MSLSGYRKYFYISEILFVTRIFLVQILIIFSPAMTVAQQASQGACSMSLDNAHDYRPGKFVYTTTYKTHDALKILVESAHFTPEVETLQRGKTASVPGPDISFVLRVYPNHHRALVAMVALGEKEKTSLPRGSTYTVECWLQRALAYQRDDYLVQMIYAQFLIKEMRDKEAELQLLSVAENADDNGYTHNSLGLLYFKLKKYDRALFHAHQAQSLGLQAPALMEQLKKVGQWTEPVQRLMLEPLKNSQ